MSEGAKELMEEVRAIDCSSRECQHIAKNDDGIGFHTCRERAEATEFNLLGKCWIFLCWDHLAAVTQTNLRACKESRKVVKELDETKVELGEGEIPEMFRGE